MNLDSGSGAAIAANAASQGVKVIDYDRLTLDTDATDYYVSFDNEKVGKLQGEGLVDCIGDKQGAEVAVLNGSPTDNNATLFKNGYDSVINPKFDSGDWKEIDDQSVPDWDNQKALTIFEQILQKNDNKVDGVLAANDGLGNAAISALKQRKLPQVPVTGPGRDAAGHPEHRQRRSVHDGLQGDQEGGRRGRRAGDRAGQGRGADRETTPVNNDTKDVPSVLLDPVAGHQGQHRGVHRRAGLPQGGGDLRRQARREVQGDRPAVANATRGAPPGAPRVRSGREELRT